MKSVPYRAYATTNPEAAIQAYKEKTGQEPTVLVVRPGYDVWPSHPLITYSRFAAWGCIMVTHLLLPNEVEGQEPGELYHSGFDPGVDVSKMTNPASPKQQAIPEKQRGRPTSPKATCPHCHSEIHSFEELGYWWGWAYGITPPYWDELVAYVHKRDGYTCSVCRKRFAPAFLITHHVHHKEDGGTDSARNLITLCQSCHPDDKPIYPEDDDA